MKILPKQVIKKDIYEGLTPLEKRTRMAAIVFVFIGVFFWAVKILILA